MQCSVEITLYPIRDHYLEPIESFIERLQGAADIDVEVNAMSTQVYGDFATVMTAITAAMGPTLEALPGAFVLKVLGIDARAPHPRPD
ncbi:MAG TPA: hypothetical protein VLA56_13835 [Pseudomonadales bacterium]|nr:hypothetical protein [Pseudomonadales bacterium]